MIITLCGSARFEAQFKQWNQALTLAGHVVFSLAVYPSSHKGNKDWYTPEQKKMLDLVHCKKIEASDAICVINPGGYVGESTASEIKYAARRGCGLYALERNDPLSVSLFHDAMELCGGDVPPLGSFIPAEAIAIAPPSWPDVFGDERDFMEAMGQTVTELNDEQTKLYLMLIVEEVFEGLKAAFPHVGPRLGEIEETLGRTILGLTVMPYEYEFFDGLLDLIVVTVNCGLSRGYPMPEGWQEVLRSNRAKIDPATGKVTKRADGKVLKPPGWTPPDLKGVLKRHWNAGRPPAEEENETPLILPPEAYSPLTDGEIPF